MSVMVHVHLYSLTLLSLSLLPFATGAASFTQSPQNQSVLVGKEVEFVWNYTVGTRLTEFSLFSPIWHYYSYEFKNWTEIASEAKRQGWNWTATLTTFPPSLRERLSKKENSVATLVIKNVQVTDSGIYKCKLMLTTDAPIFKEAHLSVVNNCSPNPCQNGGNCVSGLNDFNCSCLPGWSGNMCKTDINECASSPCKNGATCTDLINGFNCTCAPGWEEQNCTKNINECASIPCKNGGNCTDLVNGFRCKCAPGYEGQVCKTKSSVKSTLSAAEIAGIVIGVFFGIILIAVIAYFIYKKFSNKSQEGNLPTDKRQRKAVDQEAEMKTSAAKA